MAVATVNDIHSELNETVVEAVVALDSLDSIEAAVRAAAEAGTPVAIAGGRQRGRRSDDLQPRGKPRALSPRRRRLRPLRLRLLGQAEARPAPCPGAGRRDRLARRADAALRPANRRRVPLRRLPVRNRPRERRLPPPRGLLVLPAGRGCRGAAGRAASALDGRLAEPDLPRSHRQGARLGGVLDPLPRDLGPALLLGRAPVRRLLRRLSRAPR